MSIGKITGSLSSFNVENTAALVNFNVDLTLFRCEPLAEYRPIGSALTTRRKKEAETGQTHKTACKLGFLLNDLIPDTPLLRKAYGNRVSEILARPDINPLGTNNDGPFQPFVGADCTNIWAAATSGDAAIGVLLLTCMLANAFDAKKAVSIWSELIDQRKANIRLLLENGKMVNPNTVVASNQDITRSELRTWDASARSWLRRADLAMTSQKTRFALIADNIAIPYPGGSSMFEKVTMTWVRAMEVFEKLLANNPQQACDRAIISGIYAWHLYPDLVVFQTEAKKVPFNDSQIPSSGVLSLGLEYRGTPSDSFIRWSLSLSHLKYYGDPVQVKSNEAITRISMPDIWLIALGSLLGNWNVPYTSLSMGMSWFEQLGHRLRSSSQRDRIELSWVLRVCDAVTGLAPEQRDTAERLVKYGCRRGSKLFGVQEAAPTQIAFFGLCSPAFFNSIDEDDEAEVGIKWLRTLSLQVGLEAQDAVISHSKKIGHYDYTEWITTQPIPLKLAQSADDPDLTNDQVNHMRWIHCPLDEDDIATGVLLEQRAAFIRSRGEACKIITHHQGFLHSYPYEERYTRTWHNPPAIFKVSHTYREEEDEGFLVCLGGRYFGYHDYELRIRSKKKGERQWLNLLREAIGTHCDIKTGLAWIAGPTKADKLTQYLLSYLCQFQSVSTPRYNLKRKRQSSVISMPSPQRSAAQSSFDVMTCLLPKSFEVLVGMRVLEVVHKLYETLPGATISLRVIEQNLLKACWLPSSIRKTMELNLSSPMDGHKMITSTPIEDHVKAMTRQDSFACVAMFESGHLNIDPSRLTEVIALCYENSIFVAEILLCDPSTDTTTLGLAHLVGNVGHAGLVFMVSPVEPRVRPAQHDPSLIDHKNYDNGVVDKLRGTSLHLSFTTWKMPLDWDTTGEIDQEAFLLESVVSVQDNGTWIADIDVLGRERESMDIVKFTCDCLDPHFPADGDAVSLDTWEELLDSPPCVGIFRAKDNWAARLAAVSILIQQGKSHVAIVVDGDRVCWRCLDELYSDPEPHPPQVLIY
ncbi:hypothetical protein FLONG3_10541 [Fusarium longipes]|uniref:Uncharacterized protein n=1 Tax=Fusarium longipes TaxID=694270 RepID=A0A395RMR6_9HYPO|nr:hypothetical protein FLONG3_10541 [Fusarium longipes]